MELSSIIILCRSLKHHAKNKITVGSIAEIPYDPKLFDDVKMISRIVATSDTVFIVVRELVSGFLTGKDPTAIMDLAVSVACYMKNKSGIGYLFNIPEIAGTGINHQKISLPTAK